MDDCIDNRVEQRALLGHVALCFVVAGALGFLGGGLAGLMHFGDPSATTRYAMVAICIATCFAIFWCSPNGPSRWRPFIISSKLAEGLFGGAAGIILFSSVAALLVAAL